MSEKFTIGIKILVGQRFLELLLNQNNILHILIPKSRTAVPTEMLMSFLSFSDNLLQGNHIIFQKKVLITLR